jgi:hypothetical protein
VNFFSEIFPLYANTVKWKKIILTTLSSKQSQLFISFANSMLLFGINQVQYANMLLKYNLRWIKLAPYTAHEV